MSAQAAGPGPECLGKDEIPNPSTHATFPSRERWGNSTTQAQLHAQHNRRKPRVHHPGTEAARAMQVTLRNVSRTPGVTLHPKAMLLCDSRPSVRHPSTSEPKYQDHATSMPWEQWTPGSPVNP